MLNILSDTFNIATRTDVQKGDYHDQRRAYLEMESRRKEHARRKAQLTKYFHLR